MSYYCILYLFAAEWVPLVSSSTIWSYRKVCQSGHVLKFTTFYHAPHHEKRKGVRTSKGRSVLPCTLFSFAFYNMHDLSYLFLLSHCVKVLWIYKLGNLVLSYGHFWPLNFELGISSFCATTPSCLNLRTVPTIVIAHTFCASPDTRISYRQGLLIQGYFCTV